MEENISQPQKPQPEVVQTYPNKTPNSSWKSKLLLICAGFLLLVLGGAGGFFLGKSLSQPKISPPSISQVSPTATLIPTAIPDPTADWKTYRNEKYKFSFKYPINWSIYDNTQKANSKTLELLLINTPEGNPWPDNFLGVLKVYEGVGDFAQWFHKTAEFTEEKKQEFINLAKSGGDYKDLNINDLSSSYRQTTLNDYQLIEQTILCHRQDCYFMGGPQNKKEYFIKNKNEVISIGFLTLSPKEDFPTLDLILSTFNFAE
jgi:hypothetical protein